MVIGTRGRPCASLLSACVAAAFKKTMALETTLPSFIMDMEGSSGTRCRILINNLVGAMPYARYLEIGSWRGSTAYAALNGNVASVLCVYDCSQSRCEPEAFLGYLERVRAPYNDCSVLEADFRAVDYTAVGTFNLYRYAGPHSTAFDGMLLPLASLDEEFVLVIERWNDENVRAAVGAAIRQASLTCSYGIDIRSRLDDDIGVPSSEWHHGYFIGTFLKAPE